MESADTKTTSDTPELYGLDSTVSLIVDLFHEALGDCSSLKKARRILRRLRTGNACIDHEVRAHAEVVYKLEILRVLLRKQGVFSAYHGRGLN